MNPSKEGGLVDNGLTLSCAFSLYKSNVIVFRNQSRKTEEHHDVTLKSLIRFSGDKNILELTFEDVRDWKIDMERRKLGAETVRGYLIKLRVVLNYLRLKGYECLDPASIPLPRRTATVPAVLSPEEVRRLIEACEVPRSKRINRLRNKAIISLLYSTGLRVSELCSLDMSHIKHDYFHVTGKGGKTRLCFIDDRSRGYMNAYVGLRKDNNPALFVSNGQRITVGTVQEVFKYARKKAGFDWPVHPHSMRHSFATNLMIMGAPVYAIKELMGHSSLDTTALYLRIYDSQLEEIHKKYHKV